MATSDRLANPRARWIALIVICLGQLMSILDATIVNVALPHIQRDLHFTQSSLSWVINGYLITFGSFLLLGGRLGDLIGRRRMFISGIVLFMLASLACGLAETQSVLVLARFVQGLGGAAAVSVTVAIISTRVSRTSRTGSGDDAVHVRHRRRRVARSHPRRRHHRARQLALDLLHQHSDRPRRCAARTGVDRGKQGPWYRT